MLLSSFKFAFNYGKYGPPVHQWRNESVYPEEKKERQTARKKLPPGMPEFLDEPPQNIFAYSTYFSFCSRCLSYFLFLNVCLIPLMHAKDTSSIFPIETAIRISAYVPSTFFIHTYIFYQCFTTTQRTDQQPQSYDLSLTAKRVCQFDKLDLL